MDLMNRSSMSGENFTLRVINYQRFKYLASTKYDNSSTCKKCLHSLSREIPAHYNDNGRSNVIYVYKFMDASCTPFCYLFSLTHLECYRTCHTMCIGLMSAIPCELVSG